MTIPGQEFDIRDDSPGYRSGGDELVPLYIGTAEKGDTNSIGTYTPNNVTALIDTHGQGPGVEDVAFDLANQGGVAKFLRINSGVDGTIGSVTAVRVGSSTGTVAATKTLVDVSSALQIDDPAGTPVFVDETADFASVAAADVDPFLTAAPAGDQFAMGYTDPWGKINITTSTAGTVGTMAVKYWNGTVWTAVTGLTDGTIGLTSAPGSADVTFDIPNDWVARSLNGSADLYFIVFEVATGYTVDPVLTQGQIELQGPYDEYDVKVEVTVAGALGVAEFKYTLDGGETYTDSILTPSGGVYALADTGMTITFTAGGGPAYFSVGDVHRFECIPPYFNATDLDNALAAVLASEEDFDFIVFSGTAADAATAATLYSALDTDLGTLENAFVFGGAAAIFDVGSSDTAANVSSSMSALTSTRILPHYGKAPMQSAKPIAGWSNPTRVTSAVYGGMAKEVGLSGDLKRVAAGRRAGVGAPVHDSRTATVDLDAKNISTLRTWRRRPGTYVCQGWIKAGPSSTFELWPHRMVINRAAATMELNQQNFIGATPRVNSDAAIAAGNAGAPGTVYDPDAIRLERPVKRALGAELSSPTNADGNKGHVSEWAYGIDRTYDVKTNKKFKVDLKLVSLAYIDGVTNTLSYAFEL